MFKIIKKNFFKAILGWLETFFKEDVSFMAIYLLKLLFTVFLHHFTTNLLELIY